MLTRVLTIAGSALFFVAAAPAANNEPTPPDSPAGKRAAALLELAARRDDAAIRNFIDEQFSQRFRDSFPIEAHVAELRKVQQALASPELLDFDSRGGREVTMKVRSRESGKAFVVRFTTEPAPPQGIAALDWKEADERAPLAFSSTEELDRLLQKEAAENRFSGAVVIADERRTTFAKAYGFAEKGNRIPNRADT